MGSFQWQAGQGLEGLAENCWTQMANAARNRDAGMHHMAVATVRNGFPEIRMVVLRDVDPGQLTLFFHSDLKKPLVEDLRQSGTASLLLYDKLQRMQIRIGARMIVHHADELCRERWKNMAHFSKRCYIQPGSPGTPVDSPWLPASLQDFSYSAAESEIGLQQFVVVECSVEWMDVYLTRHTGNQRARFQYTDGIMSNAGWLNA